MFQIFVSHLSSTCLVFALQVVNGGKCLPVCSRRVFPNVFHCLPICVLLVPHNVIQRPVLSQMWSPNRFPTAFQLFPSCISCIPDHLAQPWSSITGIYLNSQLCPLALILNAFEIVTAAVGLQSWVNELSIQDAEHQVAEVTSWSKEVWKLNFRQYGEMKKQGSSAGAQTWRKSEERRCRCAKR